MSKVPVARPDHVKVRKLIWERGWSIAAFARMIDHPKRSVRTIYGVVYGTQRPSVELLRQIASTLNVPYEEVILDDAEDEQPDGVAA